MKRVSLFSAAICVCVFVIGCGYNPGGPLGPGKTLPAGAGSTYIYNNTPIDTTGKLITDSSYMSVDSVVAAGMTYNGKTNVTHFASRNLKTGVITSSYINFETNGDISEYVGGSILAFLGIKYPDWVTYPIQTHTASGFQVADTTINLPVQGLGSIPIHMIVVDSITYINWNSFILNNISIPVFNLKHQTNYSGTVTLLILPAPFNVNAITTISFAPSIGYYTDMTTQPFHFPFNVLSAIQGSEKTLIAYNLK